jgi:hypothetical protein
MLMPLGALLIAGSLSAAFPLVVEERSSGILRGLAIAIVGGLLGGSVSYFGLLAGTSLRWYSSGRSARARRVRSPAAVDLPPLASTDLVTGLVGGVLSFGLMGLAARDFFASYRPQGVFLSAALAGIVSARILRPRLP